MRLTKNARIFPAHCSWGSIALSGWFFCLRDNSFGVRAVTKHIVEDTVGFATNLSYVLSPGRLCIRISNGFLLHLLPVLVNLLLLQLAVDPGSVLLHTTCHFLLVGMTFIVRFVGVFWKLWQQFYLSLLLQMLLVLVRRILVVVKNFFVLSQSWV